MFESDALSGFTVKFIRGHQSKRAEGRNTTELRLTADHYWPDLLRFDTFTAPGEETGLSGRCVLAYTSYYALQQETFQKYACVSDHACSACDSRFCKLAT
jgi:hypothetical protein